ncbi:MAG: motility associated factor glycosyltransferase family protein [Planctomycetes bacterium]|nr:motility associated factor glycosyltransferase family protein [Planctomycetota bacterium]
MSETVAPAVGNELFVHNMRLLWRLDSDLALRIDAVADDERFELEPTRSGAWTARAKSPDGASTYLHSRHDPFAEAKRWADAIDIEDKFCIVVGGFGLGYHIRALFDRLRGDAFIVCTEPSIALIATALSCVDLTEVLASKRFVILTDTDKSRLHAQLQPHSTLIMLGAQFARHAPSVRLNERAHAAIHGSITEFVTFSRMTLLTLIGNARITCKNISRNLASYVTTPPLDILRDRFRGNPGVVISAGPSLSKNIDQLAALKGHAVLCAVQTALRPLMKRGVVPDFVTSLDFHEMSRKFFEDVGDLSATHLVAEPKATWHVIDNYPGPVSLLDNTWARLVIGDELGARGGLTAGATVSHLAFYLAVYMGCDPIIFVGQDLAFTGHVFYVPGVEIHRSWRGEINRFNSMEQKEWDRIARNRSILRRVHGADGTNLFTDELLFTYLEQFEKDIAAVPCQVINATEGGARIRGTTAMTLADATDRFCQKAVDPTRFAYRDSIRAHDETMLEPTRKQLQNRIAELDGVVHLCEEMLGLLEELKGLIDDPDRFNKRLIRVDELRTKVHREARAYQIVNAATQISEFRRFSADRRIEAAGADSADRAKRQIARDIEFMTGVADGARDVKPMLIEALARVENPPWKSKGAAPPA